jgi:hypothetical protein
MYVPLDNPDRIRDLMQDFVAVFNVIDAVSKQPSPSSTNDNS